MRKLSIWVCICSLLIIMNVPTGCEPDVPRNYPEIELPLEEGMHITAVIDDIIEIPASRAWHKTIQIDSILGVVKLAGWSVASGGARNDIKVLVLDDIDFYNWKNFGKVNPLYQSGKISTANITAEIKKPGRYHLVFSNWFSEFSSKKVFAKVYLYWSIKPLTYEIKGLYEYFEIPSPDANITYKLYEYFKMPGPGANITFKFKDKVDTSNFQVMQRGIVNPVSYNFSESEVIFFTPTPSDEPYEFSCGNSTLKVEDEFIVFSPEPVIDDGFTISSSMANSPPQLDKIDKQIFKKKELKDIVKAESELWEAELKYFEKWFELEEEDARPTEETDNLTTELAKISKEVESLWQVFLDARKKVEFVIKASDPDGDVLNYYAFNLPMIKTEKGWIPIGNLEKDTGIFVWNYEVLNLNNISNLRTGDYFVRFEVSDGILSVHEDVTITITE